jgi:Tetracyclin repressor-like, C-terminal domain
MRDLVVSQLAPALRPLVADKSKLPTRAGLVASQMLGLALARNLLGIEPLVTMPREILVAQVGGTLQRYLHDPIAP